MRAIHIFGTKQFCPRHNGTKQFCPQFCPGDNNHTFSFVPGTKITPFFLMPLLPQSAMRMWLLASSCRSLPPPLIILPPPRLGQVTTRTTTTKQMSHHREWGWMLMREGDNNPMRAWHWLGGVGIVQRRHPWWEDNIINQHDK